MPENKIALKCQSCNAVIEYDPDTPVLTCPSCGSKELLSESDEITLERLRNRFSIESQREQNEFALKKMELELEHKSKKSTNLARVLIFAICTIVVIALVGFLVFANDANNEKEKLRYAYKNDTYEVPTNWFVQRAPALYDGFYYYPEHGMLYVTHQNIEKSGTGSSASEQQVLETAFSGMKDSIPNHHLDSKEKFSILGKDGLKATLTGMPADKNCTINIVAYVDQTGVMAFMMATYNEEVQEGAYEKDFRRILDSVEVLQSA